MSLENIIQKSKYKLTEKMSGLSENPAYKYAADVISGWVYFTPTYALQELVSGKDADTILKTRLIGMAVHAVAMRPVGLLRNYLAKKWDVNKDSSVIDKIKVNLLGSTPIQTVVYAGMLVGGMAWSNNWDWKSSAYAWGIGVGLGALHSIPYGFVQDKIRSALKIKPAISKNGKNETYSVENSKYIENATSF